MTAPDRRCSLCRWAQETRPSARTVTDARGLLGRETVGVGRVWCAMLDSEPSSDDVCGWWGARDEAADRACDVDARCLLTYGTPLPGRVSRRFAVAICRRLLGRPTDPTTNDDPYGRR